MTTPHTGENQASDIAKVNAITEGMDEQTDDMAGAVT